MRVLLLVDQLGGGGAERVVVDAATHLRAHCQVLVCTTRAAGNFAYVGDLDRAGVPLLRIGRRSRYDLGGLLRLRAAISAYKPDILHSHKLGSNVWARLLRLTVRVPAVVCHEHTWSYDPRSRSRILVNRLLSPLSDAVIAVSQEDRRKLVEVEGLPAEKVRLIYNGIDFGRVDGGLPREVSRASMGIQDHEMLLVAVGKLQEQKGYPVLLEATAIAVRRAPSLKLVIAGEGPLQAELAMLARQLGIADRVCFLGFVSDIASLLKAADVFAMASYFEGHPVALLEAMAAGRAVVATSVGGIPEMVRQGETGVLVPPSDPHALASAIAQTASDPSLRVRLGACAAQDVRQRFSIQAAVAQYVALYEELLGRRGAQCRRQ